MRLWIVGLLALSLAACAQPTVYATVTAFHTLDKPAGTFIMAPFPEQEGSLEWQTYGQLVAQQLQAKGLRQTTDPFAADYAVFVSYAIDGGRTRTASVPVLGTIGGGTSQTTGTIGNRPFTATTTSDSTLAVIGYRPVEYTTYGRTLRIILADYPKSRGKAQAVMVYDGRVTSAGSNGNINAVLPALIQLIFQDWPGPSGGSREVQTRAVKVRD